MSKPWAEMSDAERLEAYIDAQDYAKDCATALSVAETGIDKLHELVKAYEADVIPVADFMDSALEQIIVLWKQVHGPEA